MQDYLSFVFEAINRLLGQQAGLFESMGMSLFRSLAVILLSWFGIQSALSSSTAVVASTGRNSRGFYRSC